MSNARNARVEGAQVENTTAQTYLEMISVDKAESKREAFTLLAQQVALRVNQEIYSLKVSIAQAKASLRVIQKSREYTVVAEYEQVKKIELLEEKLAFTTNIKETRFADANL